LLVGSANVYVRLLGVVIWETSAAAEPGTASGVIVSALTIRA
jgi:hypothetical protein